MQIFSQNLILNDYSVIQILKSHALKCSLTKNLLEKLTIGSLIATTHLFSRRAAQKIILMISVSQ